ncbi:MAG: hypothetical protein AAFY28_01190 [Actinomycetota bacterium]
MLIDQRGQLRTMAGGATRRPSPRPDAPAGAGEFGRVLRCGGAHRSPTGTNTRRTVGDELRPPGADRDRGSGMDATVRVRSLVWFIAGAIVASMCVVVVMARWSAGATPGDFDTTYTPTAGCRIVDTRGPDNIGPRSAPLGPNEVLEVQIHGANGECTGGLAIPTEATAIAANVTAVGATASSNVRLYPADLAQVPLLSNLNVTAGAAPTPNKVDVQLSPDGKLNVYNFRGSVHILIDIVGWYGPSSLVDLAASAGVPGPAGPAGPAGLSLVADFDSSAITNLGTSTNPPAPANYFIDNIALKPGTYLLTGDVTLQNLSNTEPLSALCQAYLDDTRFGQPNVTNVEALATAGSFGSVPISVVIDVSSVGIYDVSFRCYELSDPGLSTDGRYWYMNLQLFAVQRV